MFFKKDKEQEEEKVEVDYQKLIEEFEYSNKYLATLTIGLGELIKQMTIANALSMLNAQYEHADSFMDIQEVKDKYYELAPEIFQDYAILRQKAMEDINTSEEER